MVEFQSGGRALLPETAGQVPPGCTAGTETHTHTNALLCVCTCVVYIYSSMHCGVQWAVAQLFTGSPTPQLLDYFAVDEDATIANLQQYAVNQVWTLCVCVWVC